MTADRKPLAVGDRVRQKTALVVTELGTGCASARRETGDASEWYTLDDLERIDPAPPASPLGGSRSHALARAIAVCARNRIGACGDANKPFRELAAEASLELDTLTSERDAAIARAELAESKLGIDVQLADLTKQVLALVDDRATITSERDAARAETERERVRANRESEALTAAATRNVKLLNQRDQAWAELLDVRARAEKAEIERDAALVRAERAEIFFALDRGENVEDIRRMLAEDDQESDKT